MPHSVWDTAIEEEKRKTLSPEQRKIETRRVKGIASIGKDFNTVAKRTALKNLDRKANRSNGGRSSGR